MATTEHFRDGGGTTLPFTFQILANSELKVEIYNYTTKVWDLKTENTSGQTDNDYTISNTNVVFNSNTPSGTGNVHIYRTTNVDNPAAVFAAGSSIRAVDLNDNQTQVLYSTQETSNQLVRETDLKDSIVTSAKIVDNTIVNTDISPTAEIAVSKLQDGAARQLLQTDAAGTGVEWASNIDIPGTLDVTGNVHLDSNLNVDGTTTLDNTTVDGVLDVNGSATIDAITIDGTSVSSSGWLTLNGTRIDLNSSNEINLDGNLRARPNGTGIRFAVDDTVVQTFVDFRPNSNNQYDLGASDKQFKDLYIDGTGNIDHIVADTITGGAVVTSGTSTNDNKVYSAKYSDERFYNVGNAADIISGNTWESSSSKVATTDAIDARIVDLVDDVGGFVPIANETSFPNANPDVNDGAGTLVSVPLANNLTSNGSGVITISNGTVGNSTVTITDAGADKTFTAGFGIIVETTSTLNTYKFHRYVPNATSVTTVAGNIAKIDTVHQNITDVQTVADKATEIGNLGTAAAVADMELLAIPAVITDMATIADTAGLIDNIGRLGTSTAVEDLGILGTTDVVADLDTVANIQADVTTVAGDTTAINDIKNNLTAVQNAATNATTAATNATAAAASATAAASSQSSASGSATQAATSATGAATSATTAATEATNASTSATTASTQATNAATSATSASTSATNAATSANVVETARAGLNTMFLGEFATDPTTDNAGDPLTAGSIYLNSAINKTKIFNGTTFDVISGITRKSFASTTSANLGVFQNYALLTDTKTAPNSGGSFYSNYWRVRDINTEKFDVDGIVSISNNQFTLLEGSYLIKVSAISSNVGDNQLRIYNFTDSAEVARGNVCQSITDGNNATATVQGRVTITGAKTFEIQHIASQDQIIYGFGLALNGDAVFDNQTNTQDFLTVEIYKESESNIIETILGFRIVYTAVAGSNSIDLGSVTSSSSSSGLADEVTTTRLISLAEGSRSFNLGGI